MQLAIDTQPNQISEPPTEEERNTWEFAQQVSQALGILSKLGINNAKSASKKKSKRVEALEEQNQRERTKNFEFISEQDFICNLVQHDLFDELFEAPRRAITQEI